MPPAKPWVRRLRDEAALPSGVTGPRDLAPLRRAASICFAVRISHSFRSANLAWGGAVRRRAVRDLLLFST